MQAQARRACAVPVGFRPLPTRKCCKPSVLLTRPAPRSDHARVTAARPLSLVATTAAEAGATDFSALVSANLPAIIACTVAALILIWIAKSFSTGSRKYEGNVGDEYDAWTKEGILEYYWGEHIHLGYYNENERGAGDKRWQAKKDFKQAKYDFIDEMFKWSTSTKPTKILDVGCGFGGTSRYLAKMFPDAEVQGITLSPEQVRRGTEIAKERDLNNVNFQVMDALAMTWPDNSFDLVWACESGEHMPDKKKYIDEMTRVLKPGGSIVIACWCQREEGDTPFTQKDLDDLQFLYDEWAHPYFISKEEFIRLMDDTGVLEDTASEDWCLQTLPSWRQSVWVGMVDPWPVIFKFNPAIWYKVFREIVCLERMHQAFYSGLMEYGMMKATKSLTGELDVAFSSIDELDRPSGGGMRM